MGALALFASMKSWPWGIIWRVALVVLVILIGWWLRDSGMREGVARERAEWQERMAQAEQRAHAAETRLAADVARRAEQSQNARIERRNQVAEAREEIANAETTEARLAALSAVRVRLRNEARAHLSRANADYLSSLAA